MMRSIVIFIWFSLVVSSAHAVDMLMPISCNYGADCFVSQYFDHQPEEEKITDHTCGNLSKDGYLSTNFSLKSYSQMKEGVDVLAADDGVVIYARDNVDDISVHLIGEEAVRGRECGNGVIIEHKRGYRTEYCHLKHKSIKVQRGEELKKGHIIGQVGLSGMTYFPHLQFTVKHEGKAVDPFTGADPATGSSSVQCGSLNIYPLWDKKTEKKLRYISTLLMSYGFANRVPHANGARQGRFSRLNFTSDSPFLVFWVDVFGIHDNDELILSLYDPDGKELITESRKFSSYKNQHFQFVGKRPDEKIKKWPLGEYKGEVKLFRHYVAGSELILEESSVLDVKEPQKKKKKSKRGGHGKKKDREDDGKWRPVL